MSNTWLEAQCDLPSRLLLILLGTKASTGKRGEVDPPAVVVLARPARDSMNVVFRRFNQHWDELGDLTTLERMLGTIRPTQLEYLGCLQGSVLGDTVRIESWQPAADMKQLQLAVAGNCDTVPRLVGTWHTHPYRADLQNSPVKERSLSAQGPRDPSGFCLSRHAGDVGCRFDRCGGKERRQDGSPGRGHCAKRDSKNGDRPT